MMLSRLPRLLGLCSKAFENIFVEFWEEQTYLLPVAIHLVDSTHCSQSMFVWDKNEVHGAEYQAVVLNRDAAEFVALSSPVVWAVNLPQCPHISRFSFVSCLTYTQHSIFG